MRAAIPTAMTVPNRINLAKSLQIQTSKAIPQQAARHATKIQTRVMSTPGKNAAIKITAVTYSP
jgi:hypothetical protein